VGLEPTKTGFADRRLDRFGIATKTLLKPCTKPCATCIQLYTQNCTQTALVSPIYADSSLPNLVKPRMTNGNCGFCRPLPYHLATAPRLQGAHLRRAEQFHTKGAFEPEKRTNYFNYSTNARGDFGPNLGAENPGRRNGKLDHCNPRWHGQGAHCV
jgi:hypothetical protein